MITTSCLAEGNRAYLTLIPLTVFPPFPDTLEVDLWSDSYPLASSIQSGCDQTTKAPPLLTGLITTSVCHLNSREAFISDCDRLLAYRRVTELLKSSELTKDRGQCNDQQRGIRLQEESI